jgi:hypothetical protein
MGGRDQIEQAGDRAADAKVAVEWQRLEKARIDEEISEAREDAEIAGRTQPVRRPLPWLALVAAFVAGVVATTVINGYLTARRGSGPPADALPLGEDAVGLR